MKKIENATHLRACATMNPFRCKDTYEALDTAHMPCIDRSLVCDANFRKDCPEGEDEDANCPIDPGITLGRQEVFLAGSCLKAIMV